jgi:hypothetical protein
MSTKYKTKIFNKIKIYSSSVFISTALLFCAFSIPASAQDNQNADLIIGQQQSGSNLEVSLCVKSNSGKITLANVSNWLQYDKNSLTPGAITEKGVYGNNTNGYSSLKWQQVGGVYNKQTLSLGFNGDSQTPGQSGIQMQSSSPELLGKVGFNVIGNNKAIKLDKAIYYSTENASVQVSVNIKNVDGDCRTSTLPSTNPIEQPKDLNLSGKTNNVSIQNSLNSDNPASINPSTLNQTNSQNIYSTQLQSDYESIRTGGLNVSSIFIITILILTIFYVRFRIKKIVYFKN